MKMANGTGSIVCLDKTGKKRLKPYAVRITAGWKDGKQVRKYVGYYATQAEALIALADYHKNGINLDMSKLTLNEVFDHFIKRVEAKNLSSSVISTHKVAQKRFGTLGSRHLKDIKSAQLQDWMDDIDLKPATKKKIKSTMYQIYEYGLANDIVSRNYAASIEINEKIEKTGAVFTPEELRYLWNNKDDELCQTLLILTYTGLRIGELLSITSDNVDLENNYMIGGSKTEAGRDRVIPIHNAIKPFIIKRLEQSKYIVCNKKGGKLSYGTFQSRFNKFVDTLGWNHKIHDTRKTGISLMHSSGIPMEVVRIIVGHSGKGVTEQIYLFKSPQELVTEINKIEIS